MSKQVCIRMPDQSYEKIEAYAASQNLDVATLLREAIQLYFVERNIALEMRMPMGRPQKKDAQP